MLCRIKGLSGSFVVYMQAINEDQEKELDKHEATSIMIDSNTILPVNKEVIYCYGEVDPNNKEDAAAIERFNLIDSNGNSIHCSFNYDLGNATYTDRPKFFTTTNPLLYWKYAYTMIGKPERIIVYKVKVY